MKKAKAKKPFNKDKADEINDKRWNKAMDLWEVDQKLSRKLLKIQEKLLKTHSK